MARDAEHRERDNLILEKLRLAHSQEMAGLAVYLASDASAFVTGQTIFIEGGALSHV